MYDEMLGLSNPMLLHVILLETPAQTTVDTQDSYMTQSSLYLGNDGAIVHYPLYFPPPQYREIEWHYVRGVQLSEADCSQEWVMALNPKP